MRVIVIVPSKFPNLKLTSCW